MGIFIAVGNSGSTQNGLLARSDPLEAGGGVVGKVYDTVHGELNKLWDGRFFQSYASVADIPTEKTRVLEFSSAATRGTAFAAISALLNPVVGSKMSCHGQRTYSYGVSYSCDVSSIYRLSASQIRLASLDGSNAFDLDTSANTLGVDIQIELIIYRDV